MLYEDRKSDFSKPLKDERRGHTKRHVRQNVSKHFKEGQMCVDDDENAISKLLIAQDTQ